MNFDPALLARTYRDPIAAFGLIVDLIPIYAVLALGWGAVPLVFLYWLENVVIGAATISRMLLAGVLGGIVVLIGALFLSVFFTFHYGMFCFVHGIFLMTFAEIGAGGSPGFLSPVGLIDYALQAGPSMLGFVALIAVFNLAVIVNDDLFNGQVGTGSINEIMMAPYGRVIVLHVGIFAGAGALIALGQPMIGVLALILLRVAWGVFMSVRRRQRLDDGLIPAKVDAPSYLR